MSSDLVNDSGCRCLAQGGWETLGNGPGTSLSFRIGFLYIKHVQFQQRCFKWIEADSRNPPWVESKHISGNGFGMLWHICNNENAIFSNSPLSGVGTAPAAVWAALSIHEKSTLLRYQNVSRTIWSPKFYRAVSSRVNGLLLCSLRSHSVEGMFGLWVGQWGIGEGRHSPSDLVAEGCRNLATVRDSVTIYAGESRQLRSARTDTSGLSSWVRRCAEVWLNSQPTKCQDGCTCRINSQERWHRAFKLKEVKTTDYVL